ncbi:MAG TPA: transcriptional regulator [Bradyrhizobium sp.]|nr:transcriptional regulator [Bradyrhizobium sp.]
MLYAFEPYALDIDRRELRLGETIQPIEPQVFDLLVYLIQNRERVVSKDDLLAAVWGGRVVSESTLASRINAARVAVGDNGEAQRFIRTFPRKGFRFVGSVQEASAQAGQLRGSEHPATPVEAAKDARASREARSLAPAAGSNDGLKERPTPQPALAPDSALIVGISQKAVVLLGGGALVLAAALILLFWSTLSSLRSTFHPRQGQMFDASIVPLVSDATRRSLASYPNRPDAKALAIAGDGWGVADAATDLESAKREALMHCATRAKRACKIYAVGMNVVWSRESLPIPEAADLHSEPLDRPLIAEAIPTLSLANRRRLAETYPAAQNHKALALTTGGSWTVREKGTRGEAARLAVEGCTEFHQRPCLLLSVDGVLTIELPTSRKIARIFVPSTEAEISVQEKDAIQRVYQGRDWRALARGKAGTWHAVAAASSESAAIEAALQLCSRNDSECRLYAISNFRIADE